MLKQKHLSIILILLVVLAASPVITAQTENPIAAPTFNLTLLDGQKIDSSSLRGKIIVLSFWFTGCAPCIAEMPKLNELVKKFRSDNIVFLAPTWDEAKIVPAFLKKHQFDYQIAPSAMSLILKTCSDGKGNIKMPTNLIINQEGNIEFKTGSLIVKGNDENLQKFIDTINRLLEKKTN